jgi:hypothetical protein
MLVDLAPAAVCPRTRASEHHASLVAYAVISVVTELGLEYVRPNTTLLWWWPLLTVSTLNCVGILKAKGLKPRGIKSPISATGSHHGEVGSTGTPRHRTSPGRVRSPTSPTSSSSRSQFRSERSGPGFAM